MQVHNRPIYENQKKEVENLALLAAPVVPGFENRFYSGKKRGLGVAEKGDGQDVEDENPSATSTMHSTAVPVNIVLRRRMELESKFQKVEDLRKRDERAIRDKVEVRKALRNARFERLLEYTAGDRPRMDEHLKEQGTINLDSFFLTKRGSVAMATEPSLIEVAREIARSIVDLEQKQEHRRMDAQTLRQDLLEAPLARQVFSRLNPPDRSGCKSVAFSLPGQAKAASVNLRADPAKFSSLELARENAFHEAATRFLNSPTPSLSLSRSSPSLNLQRLSFDGNQKDIGLPRARSRPVLEPMSWGQVALSGTMVGLSTQVGGRRSAAEPGIFVPDESDGVLCAGTRISRDHSYGDKGILKGTVAKSGEATDYRTAYGGGCTAPLQDHFMFETGDRVTNLEFPLGKKAFPHLH